ncbi:dihydroorotate dehydrogenase electron transfer subunit [Arcanobacterium pinnipediorum]|uniref:Dihydroorotate dehydrogenase B (NAD(+)), electron transfer subunit n=1 Tax=Arcanobacterium pinnipediorum TaxID=1503041 RepID=A0ABY5AFY2_9ACTO|nr:dihydroorotate dehydrogenase electron transfer subunit [Arcanobacterium pinnipediorum]USR78780.1 dihydroorotate dehydrogenase electron transfer subunit [Arcanobacterium pinnipediorum]
MNNLRVRARVVDVVNLTDQIYRLRLACDEFTTAQPGQFVNVSVPGFFLRRPLAIADIESNHDGSVILTVIVAKVGAGTRALADVVPGSEVEVLGPLGNGFDLDSIGQTPVLVGGGSGIPPLYYAAKVITARGGRPHVLLGFRSAGDTYSIEEFRQLGCEVSVATEDGSMGSAGYVTAVLPPQTEQVLACGPQGMLKSVVAQASGRIQVSLEAHMGCGFGACLGCTVHTVRGLERVCLEGPVFESTDVIFAKEEA